MPFTRNQVCFNARVKYYPNTNTPCEIIIADENIFNPKGFELLDDNKSPRASKCTDEVDTTSMQRSFSRARRRAYDIVRCNSELNGFITLTFNKEQIDRTSYNDIVKRLSVWLDNRVRRRDLKYILCPEHHKDGEGIHFHGLMNMQALRLENSGHRKNGKVLYNISDFDLGFTSVMRVTGENSLEACAGYVFKYMSKQAGQKIGGRYYLSGGALVEPRYEFFNVNPSDYADIKSVALRGGNGGVRVAYGEEIRNLTISGKLKELGICEANL